MELLNLDMGNQILELSQANISTDKPFITSNTVNSNYYELKNEHLIPVFVKDNQPVISQADFIEITGEIVQEIFNNETIRSPSIRTSHPIKGRIPEAKDKPAHLLLEEEKTIYYERMAFIIEIPSISSNINGNRLNLTIGGVKAYNVDNLNTKKGAEESFKIFIGFQNKVCTNLCISTDGYLGDLKIRSTYELKESIYGLISQYNSELHLHNLQNLKNYKLSEQQFAHLIGRCRMYPFLDKRFKANIPLLQFGDTQIGGVVKDYFKDEFFKKSDDGGIDLWRLYNLFTGSNKSSYIDTFFERGLNAYDFSLSLLKSLEHRKSNWFL